MLVAGLAIAPPAARAGDLRLRLTGIEDTQGTIRAALFLSDADFEAGRQLAGYFIVPQGDAVEVVFADADDPMLRQLR